MTGAGNPSGLRHINSRRPEALLEISHRSDSSSDPSEEVLDDPTNVALSQRAPALPQTGQLLAPHGDPLLKAVQGQSMGQQQQVPVGPVLNRQGVWMKKGGIALHSV